jgi:uncharacterized membrane protein YfcA
MFFFLAGGVSLLAGGLPCHSNMIGAWIASTAIAKGGEWIRWGVVFAVLAAAVRMLMG